MLSPAKHLIPLRKLIVPPRLELALLLLAGTTLHHLAVQFFPHGRIDLAMLLQEQTMIASSSPMPVEVKIAFRIERLDHSSPVCLVPKSGGPALTADFEPC